MKSDGGSQKRGGREGKAVTMSGYRVRWRGNCGFRGGREKASGGAKSAVRKRKSLGAERRRADVEDKTRELERRIVGEREVTEL